MFRFKSTLRFFNHFRSQHRSTFSGVTVKLAVDKFSADSSCCENSPPVLVIHGLFGSAQSWRSFSQELVKNLTPSRSVLTIDVRNHGRSSWAREQNYDVMSADIRRLFDDLGIQKAALVGYSMGGRVAIDFALKYPEMVEKLVVVDITQFNLKHNDQRMKDLLQAALEMSFDECRSLKEAKERATTILLAKGVEEHMTRYMLDNLHENEEGAMYWRLNIRAMIKNVSDYLYYPQKNLRDKMFCGETLFVRAENSSIFPQRFVSEVTVHFPKAKVELLRDSGHMVLYDQPEQLNKITFEFLNASP